MELTKDEAMAVANFIDMNLFTAIRIDVEWDDMERLKNLIHVYEKACEYSGYISVTAPRPYREDD